MNDEEVLAWIRQQAAGACSIFSVCTGALICGEAGLLKGRRATTHWASFHLLPFFGAVPVDERVVVDGAWVFAAGVTAGIDGACVWRLSCAATRLHRPSSFTWSMRRSRPSTAARPRRRRPRYWNRRGNRCERSRSSGKRRHDVSPPSLASPFRPRGWCMTSLAQGCLARTEGVLAHPPTAALLNSSSRDRSRHPPRRSGNINKDNSNDNVSS